jgi:hypothetical protein
VAGDGAAAMDAASAAVHAASKRKAEHRPAASSKKNVNETAAPGGVAQMLNSADP